MTVQDQATLLAEYVDNTTGAISEQDGRNIIDTLFARTPMGTTPWDVPTRVLTAGASTTLVHGTDYLLSVRKATGSATTVNLPASPAANWRFEIKDAAGDAAINNITITPPTGTIDGLSSYVINVNKGSAIVTHDGTEWVVT